MKKLSITIVLLTAMHVYGQTFITAGAGVSQKGAIGEMKIGHSFNNHSIALIGVVHFSSTQPAYAGMVYGYSFGNIQPYVGYGYQKFNDQKSTENTWKPAYGIQFNFKENAPANLYLNAGGIGNEIILTGGLHLKL